MLSLYNLLSGFALMWIGRVGFPFWVIWGLVGTVGSIVLGSAASPLEVR